MESSKVQCYDCADYFHNNDIIYTSIKCGHVYHQKCLSDKFKKDSRICCGRYQCSAICYPRYCRRVYLKFNSFYWVNIKPKIFKQDEKEFERSILKLGINNMGESIYAARVHLQDKIVKCYYNAETEKIYQDFECNSEYCSNEYELLDISNDMGHQYVWVDCFTASSDYVQNNQRLTRIPIRSKNCDGAGKQLTKELV